MSKEEVINCDNNDCKGGKYFKKCSSHHIVHDICSLCEVKIGKKYYCPICLKGAELKK